MRIENATLKESMESMDHLTSSIHRLRLSLSKVSLSCCDVYFLFIWGGCLGFGILQVLIFDLEQ